MFLSRSWNHFSTRSCSHDSDALGRSDLFAQCFSSVKQQIIRMSYMMVIDKTIGQADIGGSWLAIAYD
jgi:hypothetical protein